jgi:hypothetical protein
MTRVSALRAISYSAGLTAIEQGTHVSQKRRDMGALVYFSHMNHAELRHADVA